MLLDLTEEQAIALRHALDSYLGAAHLERGGIDRLGWRRARRREAALLDDVRSELASLLGTAPAVPAGQ